MSGDSAAPALIDSHNGKTFSRAQLKEATRDWADQLTKGDGARMYKPNTFVLNLIPKSAATVLACVVIEEIDCAFVLSDFSDTEALVSRVHPSFAFVAKGTELDAAAKTLGCPTVVVDMNTCMIDLFDYGAATVGDAAPTSYEPETRFEGTDAKDVKYLTFSSGSTGKPKGIYGSKFCVDTMNKERDALYPYDHSVNKDGRPWAVGVNIFLLWECFRPLQFNGTCVVIRQEDFVDPVKLLSIIEKYQINELLLTSSFARHFMSTFITDFYSTEATPRERIAERTREAMSSLRRVWQNGEAVTESLQKTFMRFFDEQCDLINLYSISECYEVGHGDLRKSRCDMKLFPNVKIHVDPNTSEVVVFSPTIRFGYFKPSVEEGAVFSPKFEYYRTGDRGEILARQGKDVDPSASTSTAAVTGAAEGELKAEPYSESITFALHGRVSNFVRIKGRFVNLEQVQNAVETGLELEAGQVTAKIVEDVLIAYVEGEYKAENIQNVPKYCGFPEWMPDQFIASSSTVSLPSSSGKAASRDSPAEFLRNVIYRHVGIDVSGLSEPTTLRMIGITSIGVMRLRDALEKEAGLKFSVGELYKISDIRSFTTNTPTVASLQQEVVGVVEAVKDSEKENKKNAPVELGSSYFVTGATGYLGGWVVNQLASMQQDKLSAKGAKLYLLVRKTEEEVRKNFTDRGLSLPSNVSIVFLKGDNAKPNLGLTAEQVAEVQRECKYFYHCAAHVVFGCSYSESRPSTVLGAQNILKLFANAHSDAELHYVSTNGVYPPHYTATTKLCCKESQEDFNDYLPRLKEGYGWSKWVAEKAVLEYCTSDAGNQRAVHIYRPGNIGWAGSNGTYNANDFQTLIYFACTSLKLIPDQPEWNFEMTPVDALADHMLLAKADKKQWKVDNIIGQRKKLEFYMPITEGGTQIVPLEKWMSAAKDLLTKCQASGPNAANLANALEQTVASFDEFETLDMYLSDTNDYFTESSFSYTPDAQYIAAVGKHQPKQA